MEDLIREPKQMRAILKKEKIIDSGFELICKYGFHNINTASIAKLANVSTGIVYQYFKDKHDIFMAGLEKYGDEIFFPMLKFDSFSFDIDNFEVDIRNMIDEYIKNHRVSKTAHEEITAMIHSDPLVADYFYNRELLMTETIKNKFIDNGLDDVNLTEKVHVMIGLIDNLCHEVIYHNHSNMDYGVMTDVVIDCIKNIFS